MPRLRLVEPICPRHVFNWYDVFGSTCIEFDFLARSLVVIFCKDIMLTGAQPVRSPLLIQSFLQGVEHGLSVNTWSNPGELILRDEVERNGSGMDQYPRRENLVLRLT